MTRQPIYDDDGKIIGSYDPDFLANLPDIQFRLIKFGCSNEDCGAEFLMDARFLKMRRFPGLSCPICECTCEDVSATSEEMSDELADWGCAYPNEPRDGDVG